MNVGKQIDVLIVDDSAAMRMFLGHIVAADPQLRVVGALANGQAALDFVHASRADVVLMDLHMPGLDGIEATRRIMQTRPLPIVVCSGTTNARDVLTVFQALQAGALACIAKPGLGHPDYEADTAHLQQTLRLMSEVRVVRRTGQALVARPADTSTAGAAGRARPAAQVPSRVIGIGASTGGPPVLQTILAGLPTDLTVPVLVVQHIAHGFVAGMAEWLHQTTPLPVHVAAHGAFALPGHVYLAPDEAHLGVDPSGVIRLAQAAPENHVRPAVSYLFRSLATSFGAGAAAVLLTGMGRDGAEELKMLRDLGALTIAQDRDSSVVHGMPGAAIALDAAVHVLPPERIAATLAELVGCRTLLARV